MPGKKSTFYWCTRLSRRISRGHFYSFCDIFHQSQSSATFALLSILKIIAENLNRAHEVLVIRYNCCSMQLIQLLLRNFIFISAIFFFFTFFLLYFFAALSFAFLLLITNKLSVHNSSTNSPSE